MVEIVLGYYLSIFDWPEQYPQTTGEFGSYQILLQNVIDYYTDTTPTVGFDQSDYDMLVEDFQQYYDEIYS